MMRQSDGDKLANKLQPDATKSTSENAKQNIEGAADTVASYLPGQHKTSDHLSDKKRDAPLTHDTGRAGPIDSVADAIKPRSTESIGDKVERHGDNAASALQPESNKGVGRGHAQP
ncbi:hypothetical protein NCC49_004230 [Naganishia albida]|nr:hypothetical protein NCC49_004230 [Naganishia albida]